MTGGGGRKALLSRCCVAGTNRISSEFDKLAREAGVLARRNSTCEGMKAPWAQPVWLSGWMSTREPGGHSSLASQGMCLRCGLDPQ